MCVPAACSETDIAISFKMIAKGWFMFLLYFDLRRLNMFIFIYLFSQVIIEIPETKVQCRSELSELRTHVPHTAKMRVHVF